MDNKVSYSIVGGFVIILLTAITIAIIWLSSGLSFDEYTNYMVYMDESISGLNENAAVEYNGVGVGTVKEIRINRSNPRLVILLLNVKADTPVTRGTVASLSSRGLSGLVYISLKDKGTDLRPLIAGPGEKYPIIPSAPSIFVRLDLALNQVSESLKRVTNSIDTLLSPENQKSIRMTLDHLEKITNTLAENSQKLNSILANTAKASKEFTPLLQSGTQAFNILQKQTIPATNRAIANLDSMIKSLSGTARMLQQNPSVLIRGSQPQPLGPGEGR